MSKRKADQLDHVQRDLKVDQLLKALTPEEIKKILKSAAIAHPAVMEMLVNAQAQSAITERELQALADEADDAIHQLDRLKPSMQFNRIGDVMAGVDAVVTKVGRWTNSGHHGDAMKALLCIAEVVLAPESMPGEVWKGMSCGGFSNLFNAMSSTAERLNEKQCKEFLPEVKCLGGSLSDYGMDYDLDEIVEILRAGGGESD